MENWLPIPGYEGRYEVSDKGRVKSVERQITQGGKGGCVFTRTLPGKILSPGPMTSGHLTVALGKGNSQCVHILVMLAFVGPCPKGREVRHKNGKPEVNRLTNLCYGTRSENLQDLLYHGRRRYSEKEVRGIRRMHSDGVSQKELAKMYSVSHSAMNKLINRKAYGHVK